MLGLSVVHASHLLLSAGKPAAPARMLLSKLRLAHAQVAGLSYRSGEPGGITRIGTDPMLSHSCNLRSYFLPAALAFAGLSGLAEAVEYKAGSLTITDPWLRANPGGSQIGGGAT